MGPRPGHRDQNSSDGLPNTTARLEEQVRSLEADKVKLSKEREILQSAAKYFAGETNW